MQDARSLLRPHPEERALARVSKDEVSKLSGAFLYILLCADRSYYVGTTRAALEERIAEHDSGHFGGYTATRRPVRLVFAQHFETITDTIAAERQLKGWSRAKKEALIDGDWDRLSKLARRRAPHPSRRAASQRSSG
jgi:putative endonuclease